MARLSHDLRYRRRRFRQAAGGLLAVTLAVLSTPRPGWFAAGVGLAALGFLVRLWAAGHVHKNAELAREGPYALVRHPLYTGNLLLGLGFALASGWIWALPLTALVFFAFYPDAVRYEDAKLERLFGAPWREWAASTPALVPRVRRPDLALWRGQWSLRRCLVANGEPLYVAVGLALLFYVGVR